MELTAVVPGHIVQGRSQNLALLGEDFGNRFDVLRLDLASAGTVAASVQAVITSSRAAGTNPVPATLALGTYDATITSEDGSQTASLAAAFSVVASVWLTSDSYKAWARIADTTDDAAIAQAVAATDYKVRQLVRPAVFFDEGAVPADVTEAGLLYVNRLMSRRNSPDGVVGVADLGTAAILPQDADIRRLLGPYLVTVLA